MQPLALLVCETMEKVMVKRMRIHESVVCLFVLTNIPCGNTLYGLGKTRLRRAVHSSHQFFGEVTNQITNFSVSSHQNVLNDSVVIAG